MKTLYININNEEIQSNEELIVLPHRLDIDMLFHIGEEIANGCRIEDERKLITDFNISGNENEYRQFVEQMDELNFILFGNECKGSFEFKLPAKYLDWLKYSSEWNDIYSKNFSSGKSSIIIDLKELYEASVKNLQKEILRKLERDDLHKEIDEIVFNDDAVTRKSPIVRTIKEKYDNIVFKSYKKWIEDNKENLSGNGGPVPQICLKCGKNPCECNADKQFCYAMEIETGPSWSSERKYKFFNHEGQPLNDNEYYLVAEGSSDKYGCGNHCKTNLLVIRTAEDSTLYYVSPNGIFLKVGEYDYEKGQRLHSATCEEHWRFQASIIQNKYIIHREGVNHTLYEICDNKQICLLSKFQSKVNFAEREIAYICRDLITNLEYTINWKTGELINIADNRFCVILGYENDSPIYLIPPKRWNPEEDGYCYKNSNVVDSAGNFLWKFTAEEYELLDSNLLSLYNNGKLKVVNLKGDTIVKTDWSIDVKNICGYKCLLLDEKIYIISKGIIVDYLSESVYVIIKKHKAYVYNNQTDELISTFNAKNIYSADGSCNLYGELFDSDLYAIPFEEWGEQGDIYSISNCKKIYSTIGNERFCKYNKDKFIIEGDTYFELYNNQGKLLKSFEKEGEDTPAPTLQDNGYISWQNKKQNYIEYYDTDFNPYYLHINNHCDIDSVKINILSEKCAIIYENSETYIFVGDECVAKCDSLIQIDQDNYYGNMQDNSEVYCVINANQGIIQVPTTDKRERLYLVK